MNPTSTVWSWRNEPELMARLREAQNTPANCNQDIMTIVGFMSSREELKAHVESAEKRSRFRYCEMCDTFVPTRETECRACGAQTTKSYQP